MNYEAQDRIRKLFFATRETLTGRDRDIAMKIGFNFRTLGHWAEAGLDQKITFDADKLSHETDEFIIDTILHEIAHCIDYKDRNTSDHGAKWRAIARRVGCTPRATGSYFKKKKGKYVMAIKSDCGEFFAEFCRTYQRKPTSYWIQPDGLLKGSSYPSRVEKTLNRIYIITWEQWVENCDALGMGYYREDWEGERV